MGNNDFPIIQFALFKMNNLYIVLIHNLLHTQSTLKIFQDVARNVSTIEMTPTIETWNPETFKRALGNETRNGVAIETRSIQTAQRETAKPQKPKNN